MAAAATVFCNQICGQSLRCCIERDQSISSQLLPSSFKVFNAERSRIGPGPERANLPASFAFKYTKPCPKDIQHIRSYQSLFRRHSDCTFKFLKCSAFLGGGAESNSGGAIDGVSLRAGYGAKYFLCGGASCHGGTLKTAHKGHLSNFSYYSRSGTAYGLHISCNAGEKSEGALAFTGEDDGTIESVTQESSKEGSFLLQNKSNEWQERQAERAVSELLQREGVQKAQADKIALLAPSFCSGLVQKVSEMDGPPDTWAEMGLPDRPMKADPESLGEEDALEDKLAAAFADAYRKPGELPLPREKQEAERRKLREKSSPKPKLDFKKRKELKRRKKRKRPEEDDELEELLGMSTSRGEPYRLAQWEAENSAAVGGVGEESIDEGREKEETAIRKKAGVLENKDRKRDNGDANGALVAGSPGVNEMEESSLQDLDRAKSIDVPKTESEQTLEEGSPQHERIPTTAEETSSAFRDKCEESSEFKPLLEGDRAAQSTNKPGNASSSGSAELRAEELYRWKLQWCADDSRGGGLLAPFFESLDIPPTEVKRLVRVFRRPQVRKRNGKLPIAEMIKRVELFESLLRIADGLDAAKRLLERSKDEALEKMKEDDDVERNVRYLEAAGSAQQEQTLKAAAHTGPAGHESTNGQEKAERSEPSKPHLGKQQAEDSQEASSSTRPSAQFKNGGPEDIKSKSQEEAAVPSSENGFVEPLSKNSPLAAQDTSIVNPSSPGVFENERDQPTLYPPATNEVLNQRLTTTESNSPNPDSSPQNLIKEETKSLNQHPPWSAGLIVASFPELLFPQIETRNFEAMVAYLEREVGMTSAEAASALLLFPPAFALDVETELKPRMRDLKSILRISWPDVARMIQRWPFVLSEMASVSAIPTVDFLYREALVGIDAVGRVVAGLPHILFADVDRLLRPSLQFLLNHGVQHKRAHIGMIVSKCPQALLKGPARLSAVIEFLDCEANVYVSRTERVLLTCPELLGTRLEIAREKLDFLYDLGLTEGQVGRVVTWKPRVLLTSIQGLEDRVSFFEGLGLARTEVARMVQQFPDLLTYSVNRNFRAKVDYLVKDMGRSVNDLVDFPRFFSFSLDTRIRPRHESARAAGTFHRLVSISSLLTPNDMHFREAFLEGPSDAPLDNSQVEAGFKRQSRRSSRDKRSQKKVQNVESTVEADAHAGN